jgi:hypothetical protein
MGPVEVTESGQRVRTFDAGRVEPGRHEFEVWPLHYSVVRLVPPDGDEQVELRVPPPGTLVLRIVDVDTGRDAGVSSIAFYPARPEGVDGGALETVTADPGTGLYRLRAPEGEVEVMLHGIDWLAVPDGAFSTFFVRAGEARSETLTVRRSCGFTLRVRAGGVDLPWDGEWSLEFVPHVIELVELP